MGVSWRGNSLCGCPHPLWLLCAYDPRDRLEKPAFCDLFPVLDLILYFTLSFCCLRFSYFGGVRSYWNQGSLKLYWDRSCLGLYLGRLNLSVGFYWDQGKPSWGGGCGVVPWLSVCSGGSPRYGGKLGGQEGAEGFTVKSILLGH